MTRDSELFYRSNLESISEYIKQVYGDNRRMLRIKDVVAYTGQCYRTVRRKYFSSGGRTITAENLARMLAK